MPPRYCPRAFWLVLLPLFCCAAAYCADQPKVERSGGRVKVTTSHFVAAFDQAGGSLLTSLHSADGRALITGSRIYHDNMMRYPRKPYRSTSDRPPEVHAEDGGKRVVVEAKGRLLDDAGAPHEIGDFSYVVRYTFDASPQLRIVTSMTVGFDEPELRGFLAHIFSTAPQREFFANTTDGRICELAATRSRRTWQSRLEPLSETAPWLGCVLESGLVLRFTLGTVSRGPGAARGRDAEASVGRLQGAPGSKAAGTAAGTVHKGQSPEPLQNVFFHGSGKGPMAVFFAWLDGGTTRPVNKGDQWEGEVVLAACELSQFRE